MTLERRESSFNCWSWRNTLLHNNPDDFDADDIKMLLSNRNGSDTKTINKGELMTRLTSNHNVHLSKEQIDELTTEQIMSEIRLHGLNNANARSKQLKSRLYGGLMNKLPKWSVQQDHIMRSHGRRPYFSKGLKLNDYEYIFSDNSGLYKYKSSNDKWETLMKYDWESDYGEIVQPNVHTICLNVQHNLIYFIERHVQNLITFNYKTEKKINNNDSDICRINYKVKGAQFMLFIGNELHTFCLSYPNYPRSILTHKISDCKQIKFNAFYKFNKIDNIKEIIYLENIQKIYLLGSMGHGIYGQLKLLSFCCKKKEWNVLGVSFPCTMNTYDYGIIVTRNEQYIILYPKCGNNIYVIDINEMKLMDTYIKCPKDTYWNAMLITTQYEQELLVFGWIRNCWNIFDIGDDIFPPQYLIRLILNLYSNEDMDYIYLLEETFSRETKSKRLSEKQKVKSHWKMRIGSIVNNLKEN